MTWATAKAPRNGDKLNRLNQEKGDLNGLVEATASYQISSKEEIAVDTITLLTPGYEGLLEMTINCQVRYHPTEKGLLISYRIIGANALAEQQAQNFKEIISKKMEDDLQPIIGTMTYQ